MPSSLLVPTVSVVLMGFSAVVWIFIIMSYIGGFANERQSQTFLPSVTLDDTGKMVVAFGVFNLIYWVSFWQSFGE